MKSFIFSQSLAVIKQQVCCTHIISSVLLYTLINDPFYSKYVYRKTPLLINNTAAGVDSFTKFLGDAYHRQPHLVCEHCSTGRRMRRALLPPPILTTYDKSTIESILTSCISIWCGRCKASDWKNVRRVVRTAENITGTLPSIKDMAPKCYMSLSETPWTVFHAGLWKEVLQHSVRDHKALKQLFPHAIRQLNSQ